MATATATKGVVARAGPNFHVGGKKIFLPSCVITMVKPKKIQPPNFASFIVPLRFNKLDIRDYLYHAYNVEIRGVRSQLVAHSLRRENEENQSGRVFRPRPTKMMTVELLKPFVFPEVPEDQEPWDNQMFTVLNKTMDNQRTKREEESVNNFKLNDERPVQTPRVVLAKLAQDLISGRRKWSNNLLQLDEKWQAQEKQQ